MFPTSCHCEERSDEAISILRGGDCFAALAMTRKAGACDFRLKKTPDTNPQSAIRNPKLSKTGRAGVTLTEVIVASALLVLSIGPLLKALTVAQAQDRALERKSWSLMLAQRELEYIRARCIRHYDACYRVESRALGEGYLCTVTDDRHPRLRTVTVSVGLDQNGNGILSKDEVDVCLATRLAKP